MKATPRLSEREPRKRICASLKEREYFLRANYRAPQNKREGQIQVHLEITYGDGVRMEEDCLREFKYFHQRRGGGGILIEVKLYGLTNARTRD